MNLIEAAIRMGDGHVVAREKYRNVDYAFQFDESGTLVAVETKDSRISVAFLDKDDLTANDYYVVR